MPPKAVVSIEVKGAKSIQRALRALGETDAPFIRDAAESGARLLESEARRRAPGSMASTVDFVGVKGGGARVKATIVVRHAGAKSMEFGRKYYYRGYKGRKQKATGQRFKSQGQKERPFVGIINQDKAIGAVKDRVRQNFEDAYQKEWERLGNGPD